MFSIRLNTKTVTRALVVLALVSVGLVWLGASHRDAGQVLLEEAEGDLAAFAHRFSELGSLSAQDPVSIKVTGTMVIHCRRLADECGLTRRRLASQGDLAQLARFERTIMNVVSVATSNLTVVEDPRVLNAMLLFQSSGVELASRLRSFRLGT
jgi:hypothetical protein